MNPEAERVYQEALAQWIANLNKAAQLDSGIRDEVLKYIAERAPVYPVDRPRQEND